MTSAKHKIKLAVRDYIKLFPEEWVAFKVQTESLRRTLKDQKFAEAKGTGSEMRALFEMPETLHTILVNNLDDAEMDWFKSGGIDHKEGGRWFAKSFPEFRIPSNV